MVESKTLGHPPKYRKAMRSFYTVSKMAAQILECLKWQISRFQDLRSRSARARVLVFCFRQYAFLDVRELSKMATHDFLLRVFVCQIPIHYIINIMCAKIFSKKGQNKKISFYLCVKPSSNEGQSK